LKDLNNHYNHCNIDIHIEEKCWELDPKLKPKKKKKIKDIKKQKNLLTIGSSNRVEEAHKWIRRPFVHQGKKR